MHSTTMLITSALHANLQETQAVNLKDSCANLLQEHLHTLLKVHAKYLKHLKHMYKTCLLAVNSEKMSL